MNEVTINEDRQFAEAFKRDFFRKAFKAIEFNGISGDYVEFGSHGAMTFSLAFTEIRRRSLPVRLWACDSFAGLPTSTAPEDEHPRWQPGAMTTTVDDFHGKCSVLGIPRDRYEVIVGQYDDTLPALGHEADPRDICLAYVDCDLYTSTRAVLRFLQPRLKHGMILAFDDYFCWSATQIAGERRAMLETFADNSRWNLLPYLQIGWAGASFVVEDRRLLPATASRSASGDGSNRE